MFAEVVSSATCRDPARYDGRPLSRKSVALVRQFDAHSRHVDRLRPRFDRRDHQDLSLQRAALKAVGCRRTFEEKVSGARRDRPELGHMLEQLREDDVVVITRLDRFARSTRDLLEIAERLNELGAGLRSLAQPWADTTSLPVAWS